MVIEEPRNTRNTRKIFSRVEHVDRVEGKAVLNAETQRRRVRRVLFSRVEHVERVEVLDRVYRI